MEIVKTHLGNIKGPKGDPGDPGSKGDPFTFEDFTEAQLEDLSRRTASFVFEYMKICYVSAVVPEPDVGQDGDICIVEE